MVEGICFFKETHGDKTETFHWISFEKCLGKRGIVFIPPTSCSPITSNNCSEHRSPFSAKLLVNNFNMRQRQECELLEWTSQQSSSFIVTLNWKYKWHLQKKWQIWGHSHLPDPAEFSVSYQILSADDPPIEIEIVTRTHLRKYLSWKMNRGLHAAPCIGHLSFRSHLLPSWLNSFLCALKQISIHLIPQRHYFKYITSK